MPTDKPMTFTLKIESLNIGMRTRFDVASALDEAAAKLREFACTPTVVLASVIRDVNGNGVGAWELRGAVEPGLHLVEEDDDSFACLDCGENGTGVHACPAAMGGDDA